QRQEGVSTLGSLNIWYDETVQRLNTDDRGILLGAFSGTDRIITVMQSGQYKLSSFDLSTHFDEDMILIEKYDPEKVYTAVYLENESKQYYIKRFRAELSDKKVEFVEPPDKLVLFTIDPYPRLELVFDMKFKTKGTEVEEVVAHEFIGVKGIKAKGKRLALHTLKKISWLEPLEVEEPAETEDEPADDETGIPGMEDEPFVESDESDEEIGELEEPEVIGVIPDLADDDMTGSPAGDPGLKFRLDSVDPAETATAEDLNETDESSPMEGLTGTLLKAPESLSQPGQQRKKRPRIPKPDPSAGSKKEDDDPGDTFQMELPL
ncbi:MAG: hypothetical protein WCK34_08985, partial [Bacteroidota bacterium]